MYGMRMWLVMAHSGMGQMYAYKVYSDSHDGALCQALMAAPLAWRGYEWTTEPMSGPVPDTFEQAKAGLRLTPRAWTETLIVCACKGALGRKHATYGRCAVGRV